jgi:hypothetical protein
MAYGWDTDKFPSSNWPMAPFNVEAHSPLILGMMDIRWDDPSILSANTPWSILGVNIYRSDSGEMGPYFRLNGYPLSGGFYRDYTDNVTVSSELIDWNTSWVHKGDSPNSGMWTFKTRYEIVKDMQGLKVYASSPHDVVINIDGTNIFAKSVFGEGREIGIHNSKLFDPIKQTFIDPILPNESSTVYVTYKTNFNEIRDDLDRKITYRVSSVGVSNEGLMLETPLEYCQPIIYTKVEKLDYIWREAVRRNNWILEQGGERVKLFIRRTSGNVCDCITSTKRASYIKQPRNDCLQCFGTGYISGYEGPYDIIIAPDDAERKIAQHNWGRYVEHMYEVWMGPTPLVTQRDFILKQSGEAFSIGPVRKPTNRGNILQQHFNINSLDVYDVRYRVPVNGLEGLPWPNTRTTIWPDERILVYPLADYGPMNQMVPSEHSPQYYPAGNEYQATPEGTEKSNIDDSREHRGRTATWENISY